LTLFIFGVTFNAACRWDEAAADYQAVLAVAPQDPVPWNNLGNTYMGEATQHRASWLT
jgi:Flp pilus assembly protein TadD